MQSEVLPLPALPPLIIPVYQPEDKLTKLVDDLLALDFQEVILVDDGSSADRAHIFDELRKKPGVVVLPHAVNLGKGAALKTAFNHVLINQPRAIGAVTVDGDGQHQPADVKKVAQEMIRKPGSLVLGARSFASGVPWRSRVGNFLTAHIFQFLVGKKLSDTQTGLRGVTAKLMRELMVLPSNRYEFELDMLIKAARGKSQIREIPIATVYENGNKSSHFNPFLDSFRIYFVFLRFTSLSILTYMTDLLVFTLAYRFSQTMFTSIVLGRAVGACVSIVGSKKFVFKSDKSLFELVSKFLVLWLLLLGISYGLMLFFVRIHVNVYLARILVDSTLFLFNFLVQRDLIFSERYRLLGRRTGKVL